MIRYQLVRIMKKFFYPKETVDTLLTDKESIEIEKSQVVDFPSNLPMASHTHTTSEISNFPTTMTPSSHDHGNIANGGIITGKNNKNVVTDSNGKITTEDKYVHPSHPAVNGVPSSNLNLDFGGNFQVSQPVVDNQGHVSELTARTLSLPTLPIASKSKQGIIQIGEDSNSAAAGNHSHSAVNIPFTATIEEWQGIGNPTNVNDAVNTSFEYTCNILDEKQDTLEKENYDCTNSSLNNAVVHYTKYGKLVIADFNFKHSAGSNPRHLCMIVPEYAPSSHYTSLPAVQLVDTNTGYRNTVYMTKDNDGMYQLYLIVATKSKSQTVAGQLIWVTD